MLVLVTYDVSVATAAGRRRLRNISKTCVDYGVRVQYSVFECDIEPAQWVKLKARLLDQYDSKKDSLRFYYLGANWRGNVEHHGAKPAPDLLEDTLIV